MSEHRIPLDVLEVERPCTRDWSAMKGTDCVRFCGHCRKNVYNLSGMSRAEAQRLLDVHEGDVCVRLVRRADGTVVTADADSDASTPLTSTLVWVLILLLLTLGPIAAVAFASSNQVIMGGLKPPSTGGPVW